MADSQSSMDDQLEYSSSDDDDYENEGAANMSELLNSAQRQPMANQAFKAHFGANTMKQSALLPSRPAGFQVGKQNNNFTIGGSNTGQATNALGINSRIKYFPWADWDEWLDLYYKIARLPSFKKFSSD